MKSLLRCIARFLVIALILGGFPRGAAAQGLLREIYEGIPGESVMTLTNAPIFPDEPSETAVVSGAFEAPSDFGENYGQRLRGFLVPPISGDYTFWIASDDGSRLYLSTDDDPANKRLIAGVNTWTGRREWDKEPGQQSEAIRLNASQIYYVEALMKEGGGGDHVSVRWQLPNGEIEEPIPGERLVPWGAEFTKPVITKQPSTQIVREGDRVIFEVEIKNQTPTRYQWHRNGRAIPKATHRRLIISSVSLSNDGDQFRVVIENDQGTAVSSDVPLFVLPDRERPEIESVHNVGSSEIVLRFSEPVSRETATDAQNYTISGGVTVQSIDLGDEESVVTLNVSGLSLGAEHTIRVSGVEDQAEQPNRIAAGTSVRFTAIGLAPVGIGTDGLERRFRSGTPFTEMALTGGQIGGTSDQFLFGRQSLEGDFDLRVNVGALNDPTPYVKAGLMARSKLEQTSRFAGVFATPKINGAYFEYRDPSSSPTERSGSFRVSFPDTWLRLRREGDRLIGYAGTDGEHWKSLGSRTFTDLPDTIYVGLGVAGQAPETSVAASFGRVTEVTAPQAMPAKGRDRAPLGPSSRDTDLVISEVMYHPKGEASDPALEYVEIFNSQPVFEDLSGYRLEGSVNYQIPEGTTLGGGEFLVVAKEPDALRDATDAERVMGPYAGSFPNDSGVVELRNARDALLLQVTYRDDPPWPASADGAGHSLVLARPSYGERDHRAWAASDRIGGSPGATDRFEDDPLKSIVINEFLAHTDPPQRDFVELYNQSRQSVDLSGAFLTDSRDRNRFVIPDGTTIPAGGLLALDQEQLGFALDSSGETVYFVNPTETRVVDAIRFGPQLNGISSGRFRDGNETIAPLSMPTPGEANRDYRVGPIVINEILFHPPSEQAGDELVELYNRGSDPVDLSGWRFVDGIELTVPEETIVDPGGYLVVAKDRDHLIQRYEALDESNVVGSYAGRLSNSGERIALARPLDNVVTNASGQAVTNQMYAVVDEVDFGEGGRWTEWADGDGSSLELRDPDSDNRLAANWADSDETAKSEWVTVERTGILDHGRGAINEVHGLLLGKGECLIDQVEVSVEGGPNLVSDPDFDGIGSGWVAQGNHVHSSVERPGFESAGAFQIRASGGGDTGANRVENDLEGELREGSRATIRAKARWLRGHPNLLLRLRGNHLEAVGHLPVPTNLGTPGRQNSQAKENVGPAVHDVEHSPILPQASEPVTITARVHDPDGIASVTLKYRFDPSVTTTSVTMQDTGEGADESAGDGIFTATIPGQAAGVLAAYYVEATDASEARLTGRFPDAAPEREALVQFGETEPAGSFDTYRLWMTQENVDEWTERPELSNEGLHGTIVYNSQRVIHNITARFRGSPFIRPRFEGPTGPISAYALEIPQDDLLLGSDEFNLDWLEQPDRDPTLQSEKMSFWIAEQLGLPFTHQRYVKIFFNGVKRGEVYTDSFHLDKSYMSTWFPENDNGEIFKIDDWFEFDDGLSREFNVNATLEKFRTEGGRKKKARYRWNWEKKANRGLNDDYSSLFELVDAVNVSGDAVYTEAVTSTIDLDQWMGAFALRHIVGDWDGYGYRRGKNMFTYKPVGGRWKMLLWDLDFALGASSDGTTHDLFDVHDPTIERMYQHPPFRRAYLQVMHRAVNGPLRNENADPVMDANFKAFQENDVEAAPPDEIKSWIDRRREFIREQLDDVNAPFEVTEPVESSTVTDEPRITLRGTAPIAMKRLRINGIAQPVRWTTLTNWVVDGYPLSARENRLSVSGVDVEDKALSEGDVDLSVTFSGEIARPQDHVVINEIMYHPAEHRDAEFIELFNTSEEQGFDLSGFRLDGVDFDFPEGTVIEPNAILLVVKDRGRFEAAFGDRAGIVGEYAGRLNNAGEHLRLLGPESTPDGPALIDEVLYDDDAPWPAAADGTGPSLQLRDPERDNTRVGNWQAVGGAAPGGDGWQFVSDTGTASSSRLTLSLDGLGRRYVDDIALVEGIIPRIGENLLANPGFESGFGEGWGAGAGSGTATVTAERPHSGDFALLLERPANGSDEPILFQEIIPSLTEGERYTLSYWTMAESGSPPIRAQLDGGGLTSVAGDEESALSRATPGEANSVRSVLPAFEDLWINEVLPRNVNGARDSAGDRDPWIELYNAGTTPISLDSFYLSNGYRDLRAWRLPIGRVLEPGELAVIWADGEPEEASDEEWHADFRLTRSDGAVALSRRQGNETILADYVNYGAVSPGRSIGDFPDGGALEPQLFQIPTPGGPNDPTFLPVQVVINEWMASNDLALADPVDGDYDDWFELFNPGSESVDLSGYTLTDDLSEPGQWRIPTGTTIQAGGFLLVWADEEPDQNGQTGDLHADFRLDREGEEIGLFAPSGDLIDAVTYEVQETDVSQGRKPDGAPPPYARLDAPTPRSRNFEPTGNGGFEILNADLGAGGLSVTWRSEPGAQYQLQYKDEVTEPVWNDLGDAVTASGSETTVTDAAIAEEPSRFYRVLRVD